jgi:hypothetical protein
MDPGGPVWVSLLRSTAQRPQKADGACWMGAERERVRLPPTTCGRLRRRHVLHDERPARNTARRLRGEFLSHGLGSVWLIAGHSRSLFTGCINWTIVAQRVAFACWTGSSRVRWQSGPGAAEALGILLWACSASRGTAVAAWPLPGYLHRRLGRGCVELTFWRGGGLEIGFLMSVWRRCGWKRTAWMWMSLKTMMTLAKNASHQSHFSETSFN